MKKNLKKILLLILLPVNLLSCGQDEKLNTYDKYRTQKIEYRDSLYIMHTVKEWGKKNWERYHDYSQMYKMTNDQIANWIGGIFYSPDRLKMIVWVGDKTPNARNREIYNPEDTVPQKMCPNGADTIYDLTALIGIREDTNQVWNLYPFDNQMAECSDNKEWCINILGQYYFEKMKNNSDYKVRQFGSEKGFRIAEYYKYNLQDKDFWDSCWIWEKDTVCSYGLTIFQLSGYDCDMSPGYRYDMMIYVDPNLDRTSNEMKQVRPTPKDCGRPLKRPIVIYPDSLLKMYGKK